jgi:hypothetical protein
MEHQEQNRRREARALTAALIEITDEYNDTSACVLEDLSPSGARVHSDIALRIGAELTLRVGSVTHAGIVRHCKPVMDAFDIGIEFVGGRWPAPIELPIHWIHSDRQ